MLFAWPAISVILFVLLPVEKAAISSLVGGYLLLPSATGVDVSLLPSLDKFSIPALSTFLLCWLKGAPWPPPKRSFLIYGLALAFILSPLFTSLTNSYELHIADRSIPGFYPLDGIKIGLHNLITLLPFFVGMRFLSSENGRALLLKAIPIAAIFYSLPMLLEVRLSPQLHRWIYGFFPHSFEQQIRDGGFRPVVFLSHGLEVALFASLAVVAAMICIRIKWNLLRVPSSLVTAYLAFVLVLCKTVGAAAYAIITAPIVLFTRPRTWVKVATALILAVCAYPLLRTYDVVPVHRIAVAATVISENRSASFQARLKNEDALLAKANEKPFLGWGTWGRNRIYDEESGTDISVTDGEWTIVFGMFGWFGYLSLFGIFATAAFRALSVVRGPQTTAMYVTAGMTLLLAVNLIDLIPNSNLTPLTYVLAGSVAGCVRARATRRIERPVGDVSSAVVAA